MCIRLLRAVGAIGQTSAALREDQRQHRSRDADRKRPLEERRRSGPRVHLDPLPRRQVPPQGAVVARVGRYDFVEDVRYGEDWLEPIYVLRRVAGAAALVVGGAFAAVAILIIGAAIRCITSLSAGGLTPTPPVNNM